ncbi:hypothetical protein [Salinarchaeum laminariae]|uniref:hypothetical protein n=1 Tax=Salinarchaeum laminariae TaxID=869888 RepID=UPI0020C17659|nr:hypothetical protein [Salinarchaeum laminariae]
MVEERLSDGYRIGELLASEIDGRRRGALGDLVVANADRTVEGTPAGERAYDVRLVEDAGDSSRDPRREPTEQDVGALFARVFVHETGATLVLEPPSSRSSQSGSSSAIDAARAAADAADLDADSQWDTDGIAVRLAYGAQSKRALDVLEAAVEESDGNG